MEITRDTSLEKRLNEETRKLTAADAATRDSAIALLDEPDEVIRRFSIAGTQLDHALLARWGLPAAAVFWGYMSIDNAMHGALLAAGERPRFVHPEKIKAFRAKFAVADARWPNKELEEAGEVWSTSRYDRSRVSSLTARGILNLAVEVYAFCIDAAATARGVTPSEFPVSVDAARDRARTLRVIRLPELAAHLDNTNEMREIDIQRSGTSSLAAQMMNPGRDIEVAIAADRPWIADLLRTDEFTDMLRNLHESYDRLVMELLAARLENLAAVSESVLNEELRDEVLQASIVVVLTYEGRAVADLMDRGVKAFATAWSSLGDNPTSD